MKVSLALQEYVETKAKQRLVCSECPMVVAKTIRLRGNHVGSWLKSSDVKVLARATLNGCLNLDWVEH